MNKAIIFSMIQLAAPQTEGTFLLQGKLQVPGRNRSEMEEMWFSFYGKRAQEVYETIQANPELLEDDFLLVGKVEVVPAQDGSKIPVLNLDSLQPRAYAQLNLICIAGNRGAELEEFSSEKASGISTSMAVRNGSTDTTWFDITAYRSEYDKTSDLMSSYLGKGDRYGLTGELRLSVYKGENGISRKVQVIAGNRSLSLLGKANSDSSSSPAPAPVQRKKAAPVKSGEVHDLPVIDQEVPF